MNEGFEPPPKSLSILATVGGVVTAVVAIASLQSLSGALNRNLSKASPSPSPTVELSATAKIAQMDAKYIKLPGNPVTSADLVAAITPKLAGGTLTAEEMAMAKSAWAYFEANWNEETGLVNSVDGFASVTMWDQAAAIAALVSAKE
ncbi:MAG TPA: hypothetical protein DD990_21770, partial [Cyanobacteria bacterium UBA11368]|nr:hypothetical protein [Cyanobacteria bacterium UBA11368]